MRLKDNLVANATLSNTANIYFDFNQAIVTNTVQNNLALPISASNLNRDHKIYLYPQPARDYITLRSEESAVIGYSIMHLNGALVQASTKLNSGSLHVIKIDHLSNGSYVMKVRLKDRR
ncbi:MAG: T9SS type A sorting domain-containing protein [Saprospiraceae bacterium]|nr:T9SS type A sorting domain-containing protein [Saprospiraceae bacterium]